jgi:hypothetical protein
MSMEIVEVAPPSEVLAEIDAKVGHEHRGEDLAKLARNAAKWNGSPLQIENGEGPAKDAPLRRFNPVPIEGEPASVTLVRDRGSY